MIAFLKKNFYDIDGIFVPKLVIAMRGYNLRQFRSDAVAGVIVGLVALPLGMAFAIASGLPPERGLYTAIVAGFLISAFGGSRVQIGGPTGAFVVIVGGIVAKHGYDGLVLTTVMAGLILVAMGLGKLGKLVKFIPYPVITGFTSGIAVTIFSGQIKDLLGLQMTEMPLEFVGKWEAYARALPTADAATIALSILTVGLIFFWPKAWRKIPGPVAVLVLVTILAEALRLPVETIGSRFGGIPHGLPNPSLPSISFDKIKLLFPSALTVAALGAIESLMSAVVAEGMIDSRHRSNQELLAQGVANIAAPFFGGMPATGAIARTAANVKNGGRTPIAGMIHAAVLLLILMAAGPLAARIPLAALAGILVVVSYHMSEWHSFRLLLSGPASDKIVLLVTFFLTVFVDLVVAVEVGMVLSAFMFMKNMAELTEVKAVTKETVRGVGENTMRTAPVPANVEIFSIRGAFFFAAAHKLMEVNRILVKKPTALVLDMVDVLHIDASGLHVLERIRKDCQSRSVRFILAGIHAQPYTALDRAGKIEVFGENNIKSDLASALVDLNGGSADQR